MLLPLKSNEKEDLALLFTQPVDVLVDFCKLAIDFIHNGLNIKLYTTAASKLGVEEKTIENCILALVQVLILSCKHKISDEDLKESLLNLEFKEEQTIVLVKFYNSRKKDIVSILEELRVKDKHYNDLEWRFDLQVASNTLLHQVTPMVTMKLYLKNEPESDLEHHILQTDVTSLVYITNELEKALIESRSRYNRRLQRTLNNPK